MRFRRIAAIAGNDLALLGRDPTAPILLALMPLVVMAFVKPVWEIALQQLGYPRATGAEQAVPGTILIFSFYMVAFAGVGFFREFIWTTWDRIRALAVRRHEILIGKLAPSFAVLCVQQVVLFGGGVLFFQLEIRGSLLALVAVDLAFAVWLMAFVIATVAFCRTFQQVLVVANLGAIVLAGLGGALTPMATLPDWADAISPAIPTHWAMEGFNDVFLEGDGVAAVLPSVGVLLACAGVLAVAAAARFRFYDQKGGTL